MCVGEGEGATKKSRRLEKPRSPCYRKQVPFWGSWLRTQVSLSWRDELQRHGPRGIAGGCVAERKFRRGDLCSGPTKPYEPQEPCVRWHAPPGLSGVRVTEYKFPTRGVQGRWRQTLTPAPPSASEPHRHTVCRGRKGK